jgi:drug/metabolite transporter (DMT)-like permease
MPKRIFGREPALVIGFIGALLTVTASLSLRNFTPEQVGLLIALLSAATGAATAVFTRPVSPGAFTAVVAASVALVQGFGLAVSPETIGSINGMVIAGLALMSRQQISPKDDVDPVVLPRTASNSDMGLSS